MRHRMSAMSDLVPFVVLGMLDPCCEFKLEHFFHCFCCRLKGVGSDRFLFSSSSQFISAFFGFSWFSRSHLKKSGNILGLPRLQRCEPGTDGRNQINLENEKMSVHAWPNIGNAARWKNNSVSAWTNEVSEVKNELNSWPTFSPLFVLSRFHFANAAGMKVHSLADGKSRDIRNDAFQFRKFGKLVSSLFFCVFDFFQIWQSGQIGNIHFSKYQGSKQPFSKMIAKKQSKKNQKKWKQNEFS